MQGVMIVKFLWYSYFGVYLTFKSISLIKVKYLEKKDPQKAAQYAFKKVREITNHILKISKTNFQVYGEENIPDEPCVFVSNHQAIFDVFAILAPLKNVTGFIAKKEIAKIPLISTWVRAIGSVFIDRSNIKEGIKAINQGAENIKKGYSMVIFPEGTRSLSSTMGTMKKGSLKMVFKSDVAIVPVTVDGTYRVLEVGNKVRGHTIKIIFHKPIQTAGMTKEEQKNLTGIVQGIVEDGLKKLGN
jgi:1-acyl-sn-glycerol-3-phosphate acyltransferase